MLLCAKGGAFTVHPTHPEVVRLIANQAHLVVSAASKFHEETTRPNQLWQTGFSRLKVIGWAGSIS